MNKINILSTTYKYTAVALVGLLLSLVSCNREETSATEYPVEYDSPIEFSEIAGWLDTKADDDQTSINSFKVWAMNGNNNVFGSKGDDVSTTDSGTTWTYSPVRYWQDGTYNFYAVSPTSLATDGTQTSSGLTLSFGDGWNLLSNREYLLIAANTGESRSSQLQNGETPGPVELTFNHMLSQISFSARNADQTDGVELAVTSVKIYGNSSTAMSLSGTAGSNEVFNATWVLNTSKTTQAAPFKTHPLSPAQTLTKDKTESQETTTYSYTGICPKILVFPETCDLTVEVSFNQIKEGITTPATKTATIRGAKWQSGYNYDYKLAVTADAIKIASDPDVTPWVEGGSADTSIGSTDKPIEF